MYTDLEKTHNAKKAIRDSIAVLKTKYSAEQKQIAANSVFLAIESMPEFIAAEVVMCYWSSDDELPTHSFVEKWSSEKKIFLPVVEGGSIILKRFSSIAGLKKGMFGIFEPNVSAIYNGHIDIVIAPGVAFDIKRNRLGRGKGFYDRFFQKNDAPKWGVGFDYQLLSSVPVNEYDVRLDRIITPANVVG